MTEQSTPSESAGTYTKLAAETMLDAMSQLRSALENKVGSVGNKVSTRMGRGDVRAAILSLLTEQPMHGYQIIRQIEERTDGRWKPSAGSVYPTLQLLADEGLVTAKVEQDRKTYELTETGKEAAAEVVDDPEEADRVLRLLPSKYPQQASLPIVMPTRDQVRIFRVVPTVISVLDYSKGFGHTDTVTC